MILLEDFGGESLEQWMHKHPDFCLMPLSGFLRLAITLSDILGKIHAANPYYRGLRYVREILKIIPEIPEPILLAQIFAKLTYARTYSSRFYRC
ncbi:hypothetical protein WKK05_05345 [Nostoc sp. UHCC 0302]|uniref:hypothetical protein n=1 Tax=Nostoc sp. UHCC 0302 TaxID=3134896 RepID=UPI00311CB9C7